MPQTYWYRKMINTAKKSSRRDCESLWLVDKTTTQPLCHKKLNLTFPFFDTISTLIDITMKNTFMHGAISFYLCTSNKTLFVHYSKYLYGSMVSNWYSLFHASTILLFFIVIFLFLTFIINGCNHFIVQMQIMCLSISIPNKL